VLVLCDGTFVCLHMIHVRCGTLNVSDARPVVWVVFCGLFCLGYFSVCN